MKEIIIWGTGWNAQHCLSNINYNVCGIVAYVESVPEKIQFKGVPVISPEKLQEFHYDCIIIASQYISENNDVLVQNRNSSIDVIDWVDFREHPYDYPEKLWNYFSDNFLSLFLLSNNENIVDFEFFKDKYKNEYTQLMQKDLIYVYNLRLDELRLSASKLIEILLERGMQDKIGVLFIPDQTKLDLVWYHKLLLELEKYCFILWDDMRVFYSCFAKQFKDKLVFEKRGKILGRPIYCRTIATSRYMQCNYCFEPSVLQGKIDTARKIHFFYFYSSRIGETINRIWWLANAPKEEGELFVLIPEDYGRVFTLGPNACLIELVSRRFCMIREESELWFWVRNIFKYFDKCVYHQDIDYNNIFRIDGAVGVPTLDFEPRELDFGKKMIKQKLDVDADNYACILFRDTRYLATVLSSVDDRHNDYRNNGFSVARDAIENLQRQGIKTVRMGQLMDTIPEYENCIDFPNKCYDEFLDLMLHRYCKFILSDSAGGVFISGLWGRPMAILDVYPVLVIGLAYKKEDLTIFHKIKNVKEDRILSISETIQRYCEFQVEFLSDFEYFRENNLEIIPITSAEICNLAMEMNSRLDGTWVEQPDDKQLRLDFDKIVKWVCKKKGIQIELFAQATVATQFLRDNQELLY